MANRLVLNACSTYGRLLVTFILGLFSTWYITLNLGLQGLGLVGLAAGSFGLSMALERGSDAAIGRELAEAIAKRDRGGNFPRIGRNFCGLCPSRPLGCWNHLGFDPRHFERESQFGDARRQCPASIFHASVV